jgi:sec-independent protein translocase protein TatA
MFGSLGIPELLLIFVVILIVFGPRRLPEIGKTLGKALGEFRKATDDLKSTIEREVRLEELKQMAPSMLTPVQSVARVDSIAPVDPAPAFETIPATSVSSPEPVAEAVRFAEAAPERVAQIRPEPDYTVDPDRRNPEPAE